MSRFKTLLSIVIFLLITLPALPQCFPLEGDSPAFEFNIPSGVTITSVVVKIENFEHRGGIRGRIRSFQDLGYSYFEGDGEYEVLEAPITGPSTQDLQVQSGIDYTCGYLEDSVGFDWQVIITATGLSGTNLNYMGSLTDNLANPTYIGKVYNGVNLVSGSIEKKQEGPGVAVYPDNDYDGFGDASALPILACSEYCPPHFAPNNLDCDDSNSNINPDQQEIPDNGIDDDCDGLTDCVDNSFSYNSVSFCHTDPNPIPIIASSGGTFSSSAGLVLDANTGEIDLLASTPGTYVITYSVNESCTQDSSFELSIHPVDDASFSYTQSTYCQNEVNPMPVITGNAGGVFTSTPDLGINPVTGEIDLATSAPGTYSITYTTSGACSASSTFDITINSTPAVTSITVADISCEGFDIYWDMVADASAYVVEISDQPDFSRIVLSTVNADNAFNVSGLVSGHMYFCRIGTSSNCGIEFSTMESVITEDAPSKPSNLLTSEVYENSFTVSWDADHQTDNYRVELDDDPSFSSPEVSDVTASSNYTFISLLPETSYFVNVTGINACGEGLYSTTSVTTTVDPIVSDSLALVALYHATDGDDWKRNDNWLTGPLYSWYGVIVSEWSKRVVHLNLYNNNLSGSIPPEIGELKNLDFLYMSENQLEGKIPVQLANLTSLYELNLSYNKLDGHIPNELKVLKDLVRLGLSNNQLSGEVPIGIIDIFANNNSNWDSLALDNNNFTSLPEYPSGLATSIMHSVQNNKLSFDDILPNISYFSYKRYAPQQAIGVDTSLYFNEGESYTISLGIDEEISDNQYVWFKDGVAFDTTTVNYFTFSSLTLADQGAYTCEVTNAGASDLTLYSHPVTIHVSPKNEKPTLSVSASKNCIDEEISFTANGRNEYETYHWFIRRDTNYAVVLSDSITSSSTLVYSLDQEGDYTVRLTLSNPYLDDTVLVDHFSVKPSPEVSLLASINLNTDSLMLTAIEGYAADTLTFEWHKIEGLERISIGSENTIWVKEGGTYGVSVTNPTGCETEAEILVIDTRPETQTITFDTIPDKVYGERFELQATASSGLAVTYEVIEGQEIISLSDYTVNILGVGTVRIQATQKGNHQYLAAEPVIQSFRIAKAPQQIHFTEIPDRMLEEGGFTLEASSSTGLPLTFNFSGPIALVNQTITLLDTGEVTITAAQHGNAYYLPAESVSHTFHITQEMEKDTIHRLSIHIDTELRNVFPLTLSLYQEQQGVYTRIHMESMLSDQLAFESLPEGNYTLKIKPEQGAYLPTYLGQHLLLSESEKISLTQDTEVSLHPISIPEVLEEIGITLRGVFVQSTQASNGRIMLAKESHEGIPVVGLTIYLVNTEDQSLVATTVTDGDGKFVFTNIPPGTYSIKADHKGLAVEPSDEFTVGDTPLDITVMAGEEISLVSVQEGEEVVTAIENQILQQLKFYPNPVEDELYLQLPATLVGGQLELFDTHGKSIFTYRINDTRINCSLAHLSSGHYQLQISQQGKTYSLKILKK